MVLLDISRVPQRWIVCALCCWTFTLLGYRFLCKESFGSIVSSSDDNSSDYRVDEKCPFHYTNASFVKKSPPLKLPAFYSTKYIETYATVAFQFGRLTMLIPAGVVSDLGYSKQILCGGMFLMTVADLIKYASKDDDYANLSVLGEMTEGVSYAFIWPSVYTLVGRWAPPSKRYLFNALANSGHILGKFFIGDLLIKYAFMWNKSWSEGIMINGTIVLLWLPFGYIFLYHSPKENPFIKKRDLSITSNRVQRLSGPKSLKRLLYIPCRKIFLSGPFWSLSLAFCSIEDTVFKSLEKFESYGKDVIHYPLIPYDGMENFCWGVYHIVPSMIGALLADWVVYEKLLSRTVVMKVLVFVGVFIPSVLQLAVFLIGCNVNLFWMIYLTSVYLNGFALPIILCGTVDLSPQNAGLLTGIMFTVRSLLRLLQLYMDERYIILFERSYRIVFYAVLSMAMAVPYIFFGLEEVQNWNWQSSVNTRRRTTQRIM